MNFITQYAIDMKIHTNVSIVIVNWNGLHHLQTLLPTLKKLTYSHLEIIIVDNASTDGSVEYIRHNYPHFRIIVNSKNEGFAQGNNVGVKEARGKYVLLLNNDTRIIQPDMIERLITTIEVSPDIAVVQPKIYRMHHPHILDSVGAYYTHTGFLYHFGYLQHEDEQFNTRLPLYTAKGACILIRTSVISQIGLFDPLYFAYFEETDFCHRAWLAGYKVWYEPSAQLEHHIGGTSNAMNNAYVQFHSFKNRIHSYLKNLGIAYLCRMLPLHLLLCLGASVMYVIKGNTAVSAAILNAMGWNIAQICSTLSTRRHIQNDIRKKNDSEFLPPLTKNPPVEYFSALFGNRLESYSPHKRL